MQRILRSNQKEYLDIDTRTPFHPNISLYTYQPNTNRVDVRAVIVVRFYVGCLLVYKAPTN